MTALPDDEAPDPFYGALMRPGGDGADVLARLLARRPEWHQHAACRGQDVELFFPEHGQDQRLAKAICATCPVATRCELEARRTASVGVWGGISTRERRRRRQEPPGELLAG